MSASNISWTDMVWGPTLGCSRVSDGCQNCYAERFAHRLEMRGIEGYAGLTRKHQDGSINWTGQVNLLEDRLPDPLRWRKPRRIFVDSMSDLFHETVPDVFIDRVFAIMALTSRHTYQVLTKRPERMRDYLNDPERPKRIGKYMTLGTIMTTPGRMDVDGQTMSLWYMAGVPWPLPNVWGGTSTENQQEANRRIPALLDANLAVRWISAEPLLSGLTLGRYNVVGDEEYWDYLKGERGWTMQHRAVRPTLTAKLDWVVVGGESGGKKADGRWLVERRPPGVGETDPVVPKYGYLPGVGRVEVASNFAVDNGNRWMPKPAALRWMRGLRGQCVEAGVPLFIKQWGGPTNNAGGNVLDGQTWHQFPGASAGGAG